MRRHRSRPALLTCLLLTAALVMGCGGSKSPTASGGDLEKKTVTVASLPLVDAAGLHIAIQQKLFEAEGLHVQVKPVTRSIDALADLKNGQADAVAGANYVTFLQANERGTMKVRILADGASEASRFMALLVMPNSPIKQPKDLEGKTIGISVLNNIQSLSFNEILKSNNVDPSKVKYTAIPFPQMGVALQKHRVDAIHTDEPFGTDIQRRLGARMILDGGGPPINDLPVSGYVTTQDFVEKYPKTAAAFQRAIEKAQQIAASDRKKVEDVLPGYAHVDAQTASVLGLPGFPTSLSPARLQRLPDLMLQDGLLKTKIDMKSLIFAPPAK